MCLLYSNCTEARNTQSGLDRKGEVSMSSNNRGITVECTACSWQGEEPLTDSRHCPLCEGECLELGDIYGIDGLSPDPEWGQPPSPAPQQVRPS